MKQRPRTQEERSERSRQQILDAALKLFSHRGYGATSVQEIAEEAGLSKGNVYHHFPDKETIFRALLDRYFQAMSQPDFPFNQALATGTFPENLEEIGRAARDMVRDYREYVALIYVDVVEFDGSHVRKFYEDMARPLRRIPQSARDGRAAPRQAAGRPVTGVGRHARDAHLPELLLDRDSLRSEGSLRQGDR